MRRILPLVLGLFLGCSAVAAQQAETAAAEPSQSSEASVPEASVVIPRGAKFYVDPMPDSFDEYMKKAIEAKKVPVTLVDDLEQAEFELSGTSESKKAGAAKIIILGSWHSAESASIKVVNRRQKAVVFAYSFNTSNSSHGKKSSAESCAKHLKAKIESGK